MLNIDERKKIVERLGTFGDMVADFSSRLKFPILTPPDLAKQFTEGERFQIGIENIPLAHLFQQLPTTLFPIESIDDLVEKLEKSKINAFNPVQLKHFFQNQPTVGFSVKKSREFFKRYDKKLGNQAGGPANQPPHDFAYLNKPPDLKPVDPARGETIKRLGPLGNMVLDFADLVTFPVKDKQALARQFSDDEYIIIGGTNYPIPQLAFKIPDNFFPISSQKGLVEKLVKINFHEINPLNLSSMIHESDDIGLLFEMDEKRLMERAKNRFMETGEYGETPQLGKPPKVEANPFRMKIGENLGPLGDVVLDLAEHVHFPISDPSMLSTNFKEKDFLLIGVRKYPLKRLSFRVPEILFPVYSLDDMISKLEKVNLKEYGFDHLKKFVESDEQVGYKLNFTEDEIKYMTKGFDMKTGGPKPPIINP